MDPAVMIGAVLVAIGGMAAFAIKRAANTQRILPTNQESPEEQEAPAYAAVVVGAR
jgi:hypothetical protein